MKLKIEYISKDEIKPYANNAKIHDEEQIKQIKRSIKEFGFDDPIAVWKDNEIIEGHGRLLAVMEMDDIEKIPIIRLDNLSDEQRKAYALVHNKLTMNTGFELELLESELDKVSEIEMNYYGFNSLKDIEEQLQDFFIPDENEEKQQEEQTVYLTTTTDDTKDNIIEFLESCRIQYE